MAAYSPLYNALVKGDWKSAKAFIDQHSDALTARISSIGETVLHIAVEHGHLQLVEELVRITPPHTLELKLYGSGDTVLHIAARGAITKIAKELVDKNGKLVGIKNRNGQLPVTLAALSGSREMLDYLYSKTSQEDLIRKTTDGSGRQKRDQIAVSTTKDLEVVMSINAIRSENYDFAMKLLGRISPSPAVDLDKIRMSFLTLAEIPLAFSIGSEYGIFRRWIYHYINMDMELTHEKNIEKDIETPSEDVGSAKSSNDKCSKDLSVLSWSRGLISYVLRAIDNKQQVYSMKKKHIQAQKLLSELLRRMPLSDSTYDPAPEVYLDAITRAAKCGNLEFVEESLRSDPALLWGRLEQGSLFHIAVAFRQERIWNLIYGLSAQKNQILDMLVDSNSILHIAASPWLLYNMVNIPEQVQKNQIRFMSLQMSKSAPGAALLMQRELQWYKEVEQMVPPSYKDLANKSGDTPQFLFSATHSDMVKEGEKWMKDTATSFTIVTTLVITVMFSASFTLPGGTEDETGEAKFLKRNSFTVFMIADALSLFSSVTSVLMFLSILTSRFAEEDFLERLPKRLIIGLATLFLSIAAMMVTFGANVVIVLQNRLRWTVISVFLLGSIPVLLFALLQLPLFLDMVSSTYGPGIFNTKTKSLFLKTKASPFGGSNYTAVDTN